MEWLLLVLGAILGLIVTLVYQYGQKRVDAWRRRRDFDRINAAMAAVERRHPQLHLVQAGWRESDGFFAPGTIEFILDSDFKLTHPELIRIREQYTASWLSDGFTDGEQVGIRSISSNNRRGDDPDSEKPGHNHRARLMMQTYRYFDHLSTHRRRIEGTEEEQRVLNAFVVGAGPGTPVEAFPNPCSVGLSLFCEDGAYIALPRRTAKVGAGGWAGGGRVFNTVGECAVPWDFSFAFDGSRRSTPDIVATRGLHQEAGFSEDDIRELSVIGIHSFAWSSDILDHKFFGLAITSLSRAEVEFRWQRAKDRDESEGPKLAFHCLQSSADCRSLLSAIREDGASWAPEAVFSTIMSLLTLRKITYDDLVKVFEVR